MVTDRNSLCGKRGRDLPLGPVLRGWVFGPKKRASRKAGGEHGACTGHTGSAGKAWRALSQRALSQRRNATDQPLPVRGLRGQSRPTPSETATAPAPNLKSNPLPPSLAVLKSCQLAYSKLPNRKSPLQNAIIRPKNLKDRLVVGSGQGEAFERKPPENPKPDRGQRFS